MNGDFTTRDEIRDVYEKRAPVYEFAVHCCYLLGIPIGPYRRLVVEALAARAGDTVVEIGCRTAKKFPLVQEKIGGDGKIISVRISGAILKRAQKRIETAGWKNVELVHSSAADYVFPDRIDGIIATAVLTYEPDYDPVIERGIKALASGKRWVQFDYKMPSGWFRHLVLLFVWIFHSFGISRAFFERTPGESVKRHLCNTSMQEFYFGLIFIASVEAATAA